MYCKWKDITSKHVLCTINEPLTTVYSLSHTVQDRDIYNIYTCKQYAGGWCAGLCPRYGTCSFSSYPPSSHKSLGLGIALKVHKSNKPCSGALTSVCTWKSLVSTVSVCTYWCFTSTLPEPAAVKCRSYGIICIQVQNSLSLSCKLPFYFGHEHRWLA